VFYIHCRRPSKRFCTEFDTINLLNYLKYGLSLIGKISEYYKNAGIEIKHKIVSSIFPENLVFKENSYRTPRLNELLLLLTSNINGFGRPKNKKTAKNSGLSYQAPLTG